MWTNFLIGLAAGIAATPHCLGMCGGFPLHLAKSQKVSPTVFRDFSPETKPPSATTSTLLRLILFIAGKSFTYIFLGTLAAALGAVLFKDTTMASYAPALRLAAGLITILFGLLMLGVRLPSIKALQGISETGFARKMFGGLLVSPTSSAAFVLGLGVGFLPCPLPMGMLAVAASSHNIPQGIALMAGVGLGTAPGLVFVGLFGSGLNKKFARVGMRAAGVVVLTIGLLTIGRVTGIIPKTGAASHTLPSCCEDHR